MKEYGFGVDVGGTTVKIGFFKVDGTLVDKWEITTNKADGGEGILADINNSIEEKLNEKGVSKDEVLGIGIGVPGPVTSAGVVNRCVNLGWGVKDVAAELGKLSGLPVKVGNDANVAALGEMWKGAAEGSTDVIMVTLGTGVGGGIIVDGKIINGATGAGGEIGHYTVRPDEKENCNCGQHGCLEQYASATGVVRITKRRLARNDDASSLRSLSEITAKDTFDAAKAGDAVAMEIVEEFGDYLGSALSNMACVVNPETVVIGGGVSKAGQIIIDMVRKNFLKNCFHACSETKFVLATLGNDAGMYGCMKLLL